MKVMGPDSPSGVIVAAHREGPKVELKLSLFLQRSLILSASQSTRLATPNVHATLSRSVMAKAIIVTKNPHMGDSARNAFPQRGSNPDGGIRGEIKGSNLGTLRANSQNLSPCCCCKFSSSRPINLRIRAAPPTTRMMNPTRLAKNPRPIDRRNDPRYRGLRTWRYGPSATRFSVCNLRSWTTLEPR